MKKDSLVFLNHILESINNVEKFSRGLTWEKILRDKLKQNAIIMQVEIIGEAVKNLPIEFVNKYPVVPWSNIARMGDKLIHHYFGVDLKTVWKVVKEDLPELKIEIRDILKKEMKKK